MKRIAIFGAATFFALTPTARVFAQDTEGLLREFRGEVPAQTRDAARWQSDFGLVLDSLLPNLGSDDLGKRFQAQNSWEKVVMRATRPGAETERLAVVKAMLPKLGTATPLEARLWLLKMIEWSARDEAVTTLVPLLQDTDPQIQERARRALANNSSAQAAEALRTALQNSKTPAQRSALLNALAFRRDGASSALIATYLQDTDTDVAAQAAASLGHIGTPAALKSLTAFEKKAPAALRPKVVDALLESAERAVRETRAQDAAPVYTALYTPTSSAFVRTAALRGLVLARGSNALPQLVQALNGTDNSMRFHAARMTLLIPGPNGTKALATALPKLTPQAQELLVEALADRGDASAKPAIIALRTSPSDEVRTAAASALGYLGDASDTTVLLTTASSEKPESEAAATALGRLGSAKSDQAQVDAALIKALDSPTDPLRVQALRAIAIRRTTSATPQLVRLLGSNSDLSNEAARALGEVGGAGSVPTLLGWMQKGGSTSAGERAVMAIYRRADKATVSDAPLLQLLDTPNLPAPLWGTTFKLLGQLNTPAGFSRVESSTRSANEKTRDAAIRALADWPSDNAIAPLLVIAKAPPTPTYGVLALRGVARLTTQSGKPAEEKIEIVRTALDTATRNEEKQLLLGTLGDIKTLESLRLAETYLANADLKEAAAATTLRIGRDLRNRPLKDARPILEKALAATQNADTQKGLQEQINRAN